jgi:uncharacterized membrane protein YgcG
MSSAIRLGAMAMAAVMVFAVATPAVATEPAEIEYSAGNTSFTVTVTHNGTPVNDTQVNVTPTGPANVSYAGDSGLTDANGTVTFDLPENETEVRISTTYNGTESSITRTLKANGTTESTWDGQGPFGQWVSNLLRGLGVDSGSSLGQQPSDLVVKNNPGSEHRSDKANPGGIGPPDHAVTNSADKGSNSNGPPDHAVNKSDNKGDDSNGPPDHAKNGSDKSGNNSTSGNESSGDNGNNGQGDSNGGGGNNGQGNGNAGNGNNGQGNRKSLARPAL